MIEHCLCCLKVHWNCLKYAFKHTKQMSAYLRLPIYPQSKYTVFEETVQSRIYFHKSTKLIILLTVKEKRYLKVNIPMILVR